MGMYTEIFVNVDLDKDTPENVLGVLGAMSDRDFNSKFFDGKPHRWTYLFCDGSVYTPQTSVCELRYNEVSGTYSFIGKGDIKNYNGEIEEFFAFIAPYVDEYQDFMGYRRYEEFELPDIMLRSNFV